MFSTTYRHQTAESAANKRRPPTPVGFSAPADIIHTTFAAPVLVSDRVLGILKLGEFTGWDTYPVKVFGKEGVPMPGYSGLAVRGRCGPIDRGLSKKIDKIYPGGVFPVWRGMYFDAATWDGSDVFMPAGNGGWIFVVEAVKRAFDKAKVKNVRFTPLDEVELESAT
jgi:hypothetical protein